jgi:hypothetical protein
MFKGTEFRLLSAVIFMFVFAAIAAAHEVTISQPAKVGNGSHLQPGTYRVEVVKNQDSSEALFYEGRDLRLRVPVTLTTGAKKAQYTEVHSTALSDARVITQIRLQGSRETPVFDQNSSAKTE